MRPIVIVCVITALGHPAPTRADGLDDRHEDERVEELMEETHEGRSSPYGQLRQILAGAPADWATVERVVVGFEPMCRALAESPVADIKDSADGYIDAVKELRAAAGRRDEPGVRRAFQDLADSCGDCHFKGGMGGELDSRADHGDNADGAP